VRKRGRSKDKGCVKEGFFSLSCLTNNPRQIDLALATEQNEDTKTEHHFCFEHHHKKRKSQEKSYFESKVSSFIFVIETFQKTKFVA